MTCHPHHCFYCCFCCVGAVPDHAPECGLLFAVPGPATFPVWKSYTVFLSISPPGPIPPRPLPPAGMCNVLSSLAAAVRGVPMGFTGIAVQIDSLARHKRFLDRLSAVHCMSFAESLSVWR